MKKMRSFFHSAMGTTFMFMLAVLLLMTGTIGGVRATPQIFNPDFYYGGLELDEIGITLLENGDPVSSRNYNKTKQAFDVSSNNTNNAEQGVLLAGMLGNEKLKIGKAYPESLSVRNTGLIPEYVRVTVYKYWVSVDKDGNETRFNAYNAKGEELLNKLIELNFLQGSDKDWVIDPGATTKERTVLYYKHLLDKGKDTTPFTDTLTINNKIVDYGMKVPTETDAAGNVLSWTWSWVADGLEFRIEAEADGVQNHNARAAMKSAWGLTDAQINNFGIVIEP